MAAVRRNRYALPGNAPYASNAELNPTDLPPAGGTTMNSCQDSMRTRFQRAIVCALIVWLSTIYPKQMAVEGQVVDFDRDPRQSINEFHGQTYPPTAPNAWAAPPPVYGAPSPTAGGLAMRDERIPRLTVPSPIVPVQNASFSDPVAQMPLGPSMTTVDMPGHSTAQGMTVVQQQYIDLPALNAPQPWTWQILPENPYYRSYLAGAKEPRIGGQVYSERDNGTTFDSTLGGRVGILRYGNQDPWNPHGWQVDFEGAAMLRQDYENEMDVVSTDFRAGVPITYANGPFRMKLAYYHLSSHLGDEFMLRTGATRINYSRDVIVWGLSYYVTPDVRVYGEAGYGFVVDDGAEPWEFQFGIDYSPARPTGVCGAPFAAINVHLREEVDFSGNLVVQVGRQWRRDPNGHVMRFGLHYYNGKSPQFEFFDKFEHQIGLGLWYDF